MVQHGQYSPAMGQTGLCGGMSSIDTTSLTDNSASLNGTASEMQASLTALASQPQSIDQEDLLAKLRMVIQENLELKDTITQNNMALRQQLGLVARWSQQNELVQKQQHEQLSEVNQQLITLQRENDLLRAQQTSKGTDAAQKELNEVIDKLNKELKDSENKLKDAALQINSFGVMKSKLESDLTLLKRDLTTAKGEQERLQLERFEHTTTINELKDKLRKANVTLVSKDSPDVSVYEPDSKPISDMELSKLRNDLIKEQDTTATLLQELQDTRNQSDEYLKEINSLKKELSNQKDRYKQLETASSATAPEVVKNFKKNDLNIAETVRLRDEAAMLKDEVDTLESALSEERVKLSEERSALLRAHTEIAKLKKELAETRRDTSGQSDKYYENKIKTLNEQQDGMTAKLLSYEELLSAKNEEISKFKKELGQTKAKLSEISSEGDTIAVLRAQVEVYHGDFKAEREAREAIANDREKLRDEIRHLHQRNTQLVDELEAYQRKHFDQRSGSEERVKSPHHDLASNTEDSLTTTEVLWERLSGGSDKKQEEKKKEADLDENLFYCPKCNKSFTEIRPLEEHVNRCLDED